MTIKCRSCEKEFQNEEALVQHNRDKHGMGKENKKDKETEKQAKKEEKESSIEKSLKAKRVRRIATYAVVVSVAVALLYLAVTSLKPTNKLQEGMGAVGSQHIHSDIKVYLDGKPMDFSQSRYQLRSSYVHMEDRDGDVIHVHATGVKLGFFLSTLGIRFNQTCINVDKAYCNSDDKALKFLVNGVPASEWESYIIHSRDRILISYGNETDMAAQLDSVTKKAEGIDK